MAVEVLGHLQELRETIAAADAVVPVGARTHWEVGNPTDDGRLPHGAPNLAAVELERTRTSLRPS